MIKEVLNFGISEIYYLILSNMETITVYESDDDWQVIATIDNNISAKVATEVKVTKEQFYDIFNNGNMTLPNRLIRNYKKLLWE